MDIYLIIIFYKNCRLFME